MRIDTEMVVFLPSNWKGFVTSIFRGDEINEICSQKQRLWIEILNRSFWRNDQNKKNESLGFLVIIPEDLKLKYESTAKKKKESRPKEFIAAQAKNERSN